jgi:hypothetical protein
MCCLYWLKFFVFDHLARMVWLHFCAWFVGSIDLMVSDLFSFTRARLWSAINCGGGMKIIPPFFFSENISLVVLKFTCMMGTSCTKLILFFQKFSSISALSPLLCEMLCAGLVKLFYLKHWSSLCMLCFSS